MEKIRFTFRFVVLLAALPVIMFTELTRPEKGTTATKRNAVEKVISANADAAMSSHSPFLQAVND